MRRAEVRVSGLAGWIGPLTPEAPGDVLGAMAAALRPVPGTTTRTRATPSGGVALCGGAPGDWFEDDTGATCAVSGEPRWTDPALAAVAAARGHAAAFAGGYRRFGADVLDRLYGRFAVALVGPRGEDGFVAIDRAGLETMAYRIADGRGLVFASTADGVCRHPSVRAELAPDALFDFLHFSVISAPQTVYRDVLKMLPAQCLGMHDGTTQARTYWHMPYVEDDRGDEQALAAELFAALRAAVGRVVDDADPDRIGAFLSGGLDSSTVVGLVGERLSRPVPSFTIVFDAEAYDERRYAELAAAHFGSPHHTYAVTPADTAELLPRLADAYDEPFGNASAVPAYYCARLARDHGVGLMIAGDGGDEIFAGNARYVMQQQFELYQRVPRVLRRALEPLVRGVPFGDRLPLVRRARGYIRRAAVPMPERMETYNYLNEASYADVFEPGFLDRVDRTGPARRLAAVYDRCASASLLQRMMHFDLHVTLADNDLRKVDRMGRLAGMAVRYPFLDDEVLAFSARVPPHLLIQRLKLRHFYKRAVRGYLPDPIIAKTKQGFGLPVRVWLASPGPLRDFVMDVLNAFKARGIVRGAFMDRILRDWDAEEARLYAQLVWYLVVLELWLQARNPSERLTVS